jgi:hypothetical protein
MDQPGPTKLEFWVLRGKRGEEKRERIAAFFSLFLLPTYHRPTLLARIAAPLEHYGWQEQKQQNSK